MRPFALVLAASAGAACWTPARAQAPVLHDIPWYQTHGGERAVTLRLCRNDERLARLADCANAELAQNRVDSRDRANAAGLNGRRRTPTIDEVLADPRYYAQNRIARAGVLAECASGGGMGHSARECAAARAGAAMDQGVRRGG